MATEQWVTGELDKLREEWKGVYVTQERLDKDLGGVFSEAKADNATNWNTWKDAFQAEMLFEQQKKLSEHSTLMDAKLEVLRQLIQLSGNKDEKKEYNRCMTTQRNFSALPKYNGKHEDYDDWRFNMTTFVSEEVEFKELMLLLEKEAEVPSEDRVKALLTATTEKLKEANPNKTIDQA